MSVGRLASLISGPRDLLEGGIRQTRRVRKRLWQQRHFSADEEHTKVFVMGCQRSGTKMTIGVLGRAPEVWAHDHRLFDLVYFGRHDPAYRKSEGGGMARLKSPDRLARVLARSRAPVVAVHAIAEAQNARRLLARFPELRVIWIYRDCADVANSAVRAWGGHQKDVIHRLQDREWAHLKWRGENVDPDVRRRLCELYEENLTPHEGGALFWYLRNHFFFSERLGGDGRVQLLKYEDVVREPERHFGRVFDFLELPFEPELVSHIYASSVGKEERPAFRPEVAALCEELTRQLDEAYAAQEVPA